MNSAPKIAVILAGGQARRFGGKDKGEIIIGGERLVDIIVGRLNDQCDKIIISGRHDYGLGLDAIPDGPNAPGGPVGGIYSVWGSLQDRGVEGFFTAPIDGPNVPLNLINRLQSQNASTIAVDNKGTHPTFAWWRMEDLSRAFKNIDAQASISLKKLAKITEAKSVDWDGKTSFININRPEDIQGL